MALTTTLQTAISGLKTNERNIQLIAENLTNAEVPGYARKKLGVESVYNNDMGQGVRIREVRRVVDTFMTVEQRRQLANVGKAEVLEEFHMNVQNLFGKPGEDTSFNAYINDFAISMQRVASTPESAVFRRDVVDRGIRLADKIATLASQISRLRQEADHRIAEGIEFINSKITIIAALNQKIGEMPDKNIATSAEDERDRALLELAEYLPIQTFPEVNNQIMVKAAGKPLVVGTTAYEFAYDPVSGPLTPDVTLANGLIQEIRVSQFGYSITSDMTSGKLAGWIAIRDEEVPDKLQEQLDELTKVLRDEVNAIHNLGTAYPPPTTLTGNRSMASGVATAFTGSGTVRVAVVDPSTGQYVNELQINLAGLATVNDLVTAVNTAANWNTGVASATASLNSSNQFVLTAAGSQGLAITTLAGAGTESVTGLGFSHYFGLNDFFTTGDRLAEDGDPLGRIGLANDLEVSSRIVADYNLLACGTLDTTNPLTVPITDQIALSKGDGSTLQSIVDKLYDQTQAFSAAGEIAAQSDSIINYAGQIVAHSTVKAINAQNDHLYHQDAYDVAKQSVDEVQRVDRDEELSNLIIYESAYAATARLITIVDHLLEVLLGII